MLAPRSQDLSNPRTGPDRWWGGHTERYYAASSLARNEVQAHLKPWDSTPHVGVPWQCRGLRPVSVQSATEPWADEARSMWEGAAGPYGFTHLHRPAHKLDRKDETGVVDMVRDDHSQPAILADNLKRYHESLRKAKVAI